MIRRIRKGEADLFKAIRLAALKDAPEAFSSSYKSSLARSEESWSTQADAAAEAPDRAIFLAFDATGQPVALAAFYGDKEDAEEGELFQMWVAPAHRGAGTASHLLDALFGWATAQGYGRVRAEVVASNSRALRFYQKYGFSRRDDSGEQDTVMLIKNIRTSDTGSDAGGRLRTLYATQGGVTEVFSDKAADYRTSRPDYPAGLFETLRTRCGLDGNAVVVDVGAGTGLLTQGFLSRGIRAVAVEPNAEMRTVCDLELCRFPGYQSAEGTAESIPVDDASATLITAAQAFHWFDVPRARKEFLRVLRPGGQVALIWNDRVEDDPLNASLNEIFTRFGGEKRLALATDKKRDGVAGFFGDRSPVEFAWPHEHRLDKESLLSLVFSRSYMPDRKSEAGMEAARCIRKIFTDMSDNDCVTMRYTATAIIGRPA